MSIKPNERIEFFLAKIAGEDIDTNTLTPPGAINATERALDVISERLNDIGPEYNEADAGKVLKVNSAGTGLEWDNTSGGGVMGVIATGELANGNTIFTLNKTYNEIKTAAESGILIFVYRIDQGSISFDFVDYVGIDGNDLIVHCMSAFGFDGSFIAATENSYPTLSANG